MKKKLFKKRTSLTQNSEVLKLPFAIKGVYLLSEDQHHSNDHSTTEEDNYEKVEELKMGQLASLQEIDLCSQHILKIYPNIGYLTSTTLLKLCCNNLTEIPSEIGYMKCLKTLDVSNNKITEIPDTICYLNELVHLNLSNNKIIEIPVFIKRLTHLTHLNLSGNQIEVVPSELGGLTHLISFNVSDNPIQYLPIELNRISTLAEFNVENCPLASSFDEFRPAFILSTEMKDLIVARNQRLLLESSKFQKNVTLDMLNELEQYKKYYSNTSSLSISCDQNFNDRSIFDFNHPLNTKTLSCHCQFFNDIMLNKNHHVNSSSTTLNQEIESLSLNDEEDDDEDSNSTIEEPINNENKVELKIPTLKELAARTIVRNHLSLPNPLLSEDLLYYVSSYKTCSFCHGPYFDTYIRRVRMMHKDNKDIPFEYRLCRTHFNTNEERIKEMFKIRPITAPRSLAAAPEAKPDKRYRYKDLETGSKDSSSYSLNNSVVPNALFKASSSSSLPEYQSKLKGTGLSSTPYTTSSSTTTTTTTSKSNKKFFFNLKSKKHSRKNSDPSSNQSFSSSSSLDPSSSSSLSKKTTYPNSKYWSSKEGGEGSSSSSSFSSYPSVTINDLLYRKQPSLPSLQQVHSIRNI